MIVCLAVMEGGPSENGSSRFDEAPVAMGAKTPEPAGTSGYRTGPLMRNERDVFLTANTGMKTAEGQDESTPGVQSSSFWPDGRKAAEYGDIFTSAECHMQENATTHRNS